MTVFYFFVKLRRMNREFGNKMTRCPRLGHEITFAYCIQESQDLPCSRIMQCWSPAFDVESVLQKELTEDAWRKFVNTQPRDKVANIIELIEAVKTKK